jgi:hypothetical protein
VFFVYIGASGLFLPMPQHRHEVKRSAGCMTLIAGVCHDQVVTN